MLLLDSEKYFESNGQRLNFGNFNDYLFSVLKINQIIIKFNWLVDKGIIVEELLESYKKGRYYFNNRLIGWYSLKNTIDFKDNSISLVDFYTINYYNFENLYKSNHEIYVRIFDSVFFNFLDRKTFEENKHLFKYLWTFLLYKVLGLAKSKNYKYFLIENPSELSKRFYFNTLKLFEQLWFIKYEKLIQYRKAWNLENYPYILVYL